MQLVAHICDLNTWRVQDNCFEIEINLGYRVRDLSQKKKRVVKKKH